MGNDSPAAGTPTRKARSTTPSITAPRPRIDWSFLFGYDVFISYRRREAAGYARGLHQRLREADLLCFLDDQEAPPGVPLTRTIQRALRRAKVLVLVASSELLESTWLAEEITIFAKTGRPIIPISIGHTLGATDLSGTPFNVLKERDLVWIDEDAMVGPEDVPSDRAVGLAQGLLKFRRARTYVRLMLAVIAVALAALTAAAAVAAVRASTQAKLAQAAEAQAKSDRDDAERQRAEAVTQRRTAEERERIAQSQALAAEARRSTAQELDVALLTAVAAYRTNPTAEAQTALLDVLARAPHAVRYLHCPGSGLAYAAAFTDDGNRLAYTCDHRITIVDVRTGSVRFTADVQGEPPRRLAFRDPSTLLLGGSAKPRTLDLRTRAQGVLDDVDGAPLDVALPARPDEDAACVQLPPATRYSAPRARSRDGRRFAYVTEGNQIVTGVTGGECGSSLSGHTHNLFDLAFGGPSGRWLASAGQIGRNRHGIILWDLEQVHPVATGLVPATVVRFDTMVAVASAGESWACSGCGGGIMWDGIGVDAVPGLDTRVTALALSRAGTMLAIGREDGSVDVLDRSRGGSPHAHPGPKHRRAVRGLAFGDDDELYSLGSDDVFARWRAGRAALLTPLSGLPANDVRCYTRLRDSRFVAVEALVSASKALGHALWLFDFAGGQPRSVPVSNSPHGCSSIDVVRDRGIVVRLSSGYDPIYVIREGRMESFENPLHAESGLPTVLDQALLSRDGNTLLATSNRNAVVLIDLGSGRLLGVLSSPGEVRDLALSDERHTLVTAGSSGILSWNLHPAFWAHTAVRIANRALPRPSEALAPTPAAR